MGGRGTFAIGNNVDFTYKTVDIIEGVKVLIGTGQAHNLPEETHSSKAYLKLDNNGNFVRYREYKPDKTSYFDIDYHPEKAITGNVSERVFHIHFYSSEGMRDKVGRRLTAEEFEKFKKYFRGRSI